MNLISTVPVRRLSLCLAVALLAGVPAPGKSQQQKSTNPVAGAVSRLQDELKSIVGHFKGLDTKKPPLVIGLYEDMLIYFGPAIHLRKDELPAKVGWISSEGPFTLMLLGAHANQPLNRVVIPSQPLEEDKNFYFADAMVLKNADPGEYHLAVALYSNKNQKVYIDPNCPPIIIETLPPSTPKPQPR